MTSMFYSCKTSANDVSYLNTNNNNNVYQNLFQENMPLKILLSCEMALSCFYLKNLSLFYIYFCCNFKNLVAFIRTFCSMHVMLTMTKRH